MIVYKPNKVPISLLFLMFGPNFNEHGHGTKIYGMYEEISIKSSAVLIACDLIDKQENVLKELTSKHLTVRSYGPEIKQMAYLGFFLDAVYALTERCSSLTKMFLGNKLKYTLKDGFNKQREQLLENPHIDPVLTKLMKGLTWYDLFREVRVQHAHYGTSILAHGDGKGLPKGFSQFRINVGGNEAKKVLKGPSYKFDIPKTREIKDGVIKYTQDLFLALLKKMDPNTTIVGEPKEKSKFTLKEYLKGR